MLMNKQHFHVRVSPNSIIDSSHALGFLFFFRSVVRLVSGWPGNSPFVWAGSGRVELSRRKPYVHPPFYKVGEDRNVEAASTPKEKG